MAPEPDRPLRAGIDPLRSGGNPYAELLSDALTRAGVEVERAQLKPWRLAFPPAGPGVVHVHWPEFVMVGHGAGARHRAKATVAALALRLSVRRLQRRGVRVVWTIHNRRPHDLAAPRAQVALYPWMARHADAAIVHTRYAAQVAREALGRTGPVYLAPHGHYVGAYPPARGDRDALRARYGFGPDERVLLAFGQVKRYKRLAALAEELGERAPAHVRLLVAGSGRDADEARALREAAARDDRIVFVDERVADEDVADLYRLADLAVLNYSEVFSSGALLLALSQGLAALVPAEGGAGELVGPPAVFPFAASPFDVLDDALAVPAEERRAAAHAAAEEFSWERAARAHLSAYTGADADRV